MHSVGNETARDRQDTNDHYGFDSLSAMANYYASDPTIAEAINEYADGDGVIRDFNNKDSKSNLEKDPTAWQSERLDTIQHEKNAILSSPIGSDKTRVFNNMDLKSNLEKDPTAWQSECLETIRHEKNVILSSPTGSGKTRVFLNWAKEKKEQAELEGGKHKVYITAPIKALSNQRFRELKEQGVKVGLETGDIKDVPEDADYICCTQEIYTNKYLEDEDATLIMDEFHYIFEDNRRARTYIDSLHSSKAQNMLLASATFGNTNKFSAYVNNASGRNFYNYENDKRITGLEYKGEIDPDEIKDALVVAFSAKNCRMIADSIWYQREKSDSTTQVNIDSIASGMQIKNDDLVTDCKSGIAYYYGSMLPKEKLFVEQLFENRLIDTVVGTDALALGVNFPVQKVVFAQLAKYYDGPISKNLFEQLSGRAGRKGYYDNGEVFYCDFGVEAYNYDTSDLFRDLIEKSNEDAVIGLTPNIKNLLMGKTTIAEEASYISRFSTMEYDEDEVSEEISNTIDYILSYRLHGSGSGLERIMYGYDKESLRARIGVFEKGQHGIELARKLLAITKDNLRIDKNIEEYRSLRVVLEALEKTKDITASFDVSSCDGGLEQCIVELTRDKDNPRTMGYEDILSFNYDNLSDEEQKYTRSYKGLVLPLIELLDNNRELFQSQLNAYEERLCNDFQDVIKLQEEFKDGIKMAYFDEFDAETNCQVFESILKGYDTEQIIEGFCESFSDLLQFRKYFRQLPKKYRKNINFGTIEQRINEIDSTALESDRTDIRQFIKINQGNEEGE